MGRYPGFLKRHFGSTTWGETLLMCGISMAVNDMHVTLEDLNHESSQSLRYWRGRTLAEKRKDVKNYYDTIEWEIAMRTEKGHQKGTRSPVSGVGKQGAKGKGTKRPGSWQFRNHTDAALQREHTSTAEEFDRLTWLLQEGKFTNGTALVRPYRSQSMFAGLLLTGFGGDWITKRGCYMCPEAHDTARCCRCQCGICPEHGSLIARASQARGSGDWLGSSLACCNEGTGCNKRQKQVLDFWRQKTGEQLQ